MGGQQDLSLARGDRGVGRGRGEGLRGAVPLHEGVDLGIQVGQGGDSQVAVELLGQAHEHVAVGQGGRRAGLAEGTQAALPVDERAVLFNGGGHRQDDVRAVGDLRGPNLEGDQEGNLVQGGANGTRIVEVAHVDTTDDQCLELARGGCLDHLLGVKAAFGQLAPPEVGGPGLVNGAAEGSQAREEAGLDGGAVTGAARDPREAGARALG